MKKNTARLTVALLLGFFSPMRGYAQVAMSPQVPVTGVMMLGQLWNMVLTNSYTYPVTVTLAMSLSDARTGQLQLTAISRSLQLPSGARQIQLKDVSPLTYEYTAPVADRRENALLAPGSYIACYKLVLSSDTHREPGAADCRNFIVEPLSPPILNTPANNTLVETPLPQFTWMPPAPLNLFTDLNYDLVLVEVAENQSAEEAIQVNIPVYHSARLHQPFLNYPPGAPALDTGVVYAWMITANNGQQFAAQTNTWTFRMKQHVPTVQDDLSAYVQLKRNGGEVLNCNGNFKCSYVNDSGDDQVPYEILSLEGNNYVIRHGNISLNPGTNMIVVPLDNGSRLSDGKLYMFRLHNGRQESWEAKFVFHPAR